MLQLLGYEVTTASIGEEAIYIYFKAIEEGNPFDLVILDIIVRGGMGGMETIKIMHSLIPDINIIIASGYPDDVSIPELKRYGVNGFLRKPCSIPDLDGILSEATGIKPATGSIII